MRKIVHSTLLIYIRRCFVKSREFNNLFSHYFKYVITYIWATCTFATLLTRPEMYSTCNINFLLLCRIFKINLLDSYPETLRRLETRIFVVLTRLINFVVRMSVHLLVRSSVCLSVTLCLWWHNAYSMNTSSLIHYFNILCGVQLQVH